MKNIIIGILLFIVGYLVKHNIDAIAAWLTAL